MSGLLRQPRILVFVGLVVPLVAVFILNTRLAQDGRVTAATIHTYYIAADPVDWDYAPAHYNKISGQPYTDEEKVFVQGGPDRIGHVYRKALYREYTDSTFSQPKPRPAAWEHLGLLGPVIRAAVGDQVILVFKNNVSFPASIHVHGMFYQKSSEGAVYGDGSEKATGPEASVPPGGTHTYSYEVPERAGPGPGDPSSVLWMYHSHVDEVKDTYSGLMGPIIITRRADTAASGQPGDVDREFITMFSVMDENQSWYLADNIARFAGDPLSVQPAADDFRESNLMHSINGMVYGNLPGLMMRAGERVRWYVFSMGTEVDLHTPHWHGQTLLLGGTAMGMRTDVAELLPGSMKILDTIPDVPGTWLYHCHVNDHITAGMQALFTVQP